MKNLRARLSFARAPQERLIAESRAMEKLLLRQEEAQAAVDTAKRYVGGHQGDDRWQGWGWLIRTRRTARQQVLLLKGGLRMAKKADKLGLKGDQLRAFMSSFSALVSQNDPLDRLEGAIEEGQRTWSNVADKIREVRPPVFLTHAFLKLSDSTGIEIASLVIGGLIAIGAAHMAFLYEAAAKQSANAYWTLNDLIIQGILVVPYVIAALIVFEVVFRFVRSGTSYWLHGAVLKHPVWLVLSSFLFMMFVVSVVGFQRGASRFSEFKEMMPKGNDMQTATVMDRSILRDVYLIGTTDRTAIFLRAKDRDLPPPDEEPQYLKTLGCVASAFWGLDCDREDRTNYSVVVMDRALVVCHALGNECEDIRRSQTDEETVDELKGLNDEISVLDRTMKHGFEDMRARVDGISHDQSRGFDNVDLKFSTMDVHMDRHYATIMGYDHGIPTGRNPLCQ